MVIFIFLLCHNTVLNDFDITMEIDHTIVTLYKHDFKKSAGNKFLINFILKYINMLFYFNKVPHSVRLYHNVLNYLLINNLLFCFQFCL